MPDTQETGEAVDEIVADRLRVDAGEFDDDSRFEEPPLDADSLDVVELAEAVDANLGVHIPDDELRELETVGDVKEYVRDER